MREVHIDMIKKHKKTEQLHTVGGGGVSSLNWGGGGVISLLACPTVTVCLL